jgi:hypothetical protein
MSITEEVLETTILGRAINFSVRQDNPRDPQICVRKKRRGPQRSRESTVSDAYRCQGGTSR